MINSVTLKLTDGIDTFLGEITGERAVNCPQYDLTRSITGAVFDGVVRGAIPSRPVMMQATTIYVDKINLM